MMTAIVAAMAGAVAGFALGARIARNDTVTCPCPACQQHHAWLEYDMFNETELANEHRPTAPQHERA